MKTENILGLALIGVLVWQISKRNAAGPTIVTNQAAPRGTRWEDALVQGIQTAGQITEAAIRSSQASAATSSAGCRAQAQRQVREAQEAGVTVQGGQWGSVEDSIYNACVSGIS